MTNPVERIIKPGFENKTPRTPDDFASLWKSSPERQQLLDRIEEYNSEHPFKGDSYQQFALARNAEKSKKQRTSSPYTLSYWRQIRLCMWRGLQVLRTDPSVTLTMLIGNLFEALIVASIFYNLPNNTSSFFARGEVLFMMVLLNAFGSMLEIIGLYAKRTIVEKHNRYALYHPSAEAIVGHQSPILPLSLLTDHLQASMLIDMPYKITNALLVNSTLYFMSNMRREAGAYFFFLLISFMVLLSMSMFFRLFASLTKTVAQALAPSGVVLLAMVLYTGFAIPISYMREWSSWIRFINPVSYGFESIMVNEFHGREFPCSQFVPSGPGYEDVALNQQICSTVGAEPDSLFVSGTQYVLSSFNYKNSHRWRDFGVLVAMTIGLAIAHLVIAEIVAAERSKGEVLIFRRRNMSKPKTEPSKVDEETSAASAAFAFRNEKPESEIEAEAAKVEKQSSVFHWRDVTYKIKIKGEERTILDNVSGWVKPGTLTALMGVSGAGKTTLLDVLASRTTIGVITGEMLVDGQERDSSFQRKTGYVQQQDLHLHSSTVREALEFSALLRQPQHYSREEKLAYVDTVISLLNMEDYADAVVGVPGTGLNVEQRKRLTIGVELAARPSLLLFLDEPTSGLDSQTSWSICNLMEKLTRNGQAILCTIHQPSAILFQRFDRLLLLAKGGQTVYFGEIGRHSRTLIDYFVRHGGSEPGSGVNPAEYMLETIGAAPGAHTEIDWPAVWQQSAEYKSVQAELERLKGQRALSLPPPDDSSSYTEFAAPFLTQLYLVAVRTFQQYWRSPSYIYSKALLCVGSSLFIGFSFFRSENTLQGLQNQMFGVFVFLFVVIQLILQIIPTFVVQRTLYESRERQSRTYHWAAFVLSNIVVELCWNTLAAILSFLTWYYPTTMWKNAEWTHAVHSRSLLALLFVWAAYLFASTFAHAIIAGCMNDGVASAIANVMSIMLYAFCGILLGPNGLPGFWVFMFRVNPFTYLVHGFLGTTLGNAPAECASNELLSFDAPPGQTCGAYMEQYIERTSGYLLEPGATGRCEFCPMSTTNDFLALFNVDFSHRWRNFGLLWVYIVVNMAAAVAFYWLFRVPKKSRRQAIGMKK